MVELLELPKRLALSGKRTKALLVAVAWNFRERIELPEEPTLHAPFNLTRKKVLSRGSPVVALVANDASERS
jgi:hypothetical protein